jgi:Cys-tRNA(Pro) deacylase
MSQETLRDYLREKGVSARILTFAHHTMTVEDAERELGVSRERIIKSMLFTDEKGDPVMGIVTGDKRVDAKKLRACCGAHELSFTRPRAVKRMTGYEVGALPPVGHQKRIRTVIDSKVMTFDNVYGGGGAVNALLEIDPTDIKMLTNAIVAYIGKD